MIRNFISLNSETTLAIIVLLVVFAIDLLTPLGIAIGILYIFCLFLVSTKDKKTIISIAIISSVLTILKLVVFETENTSYMAYANRTITLVVMWLIALLAIRHRALIEKRNIERANYIAELEQMLYITNHKIRQPVANCLGLLNVIDFSNPSAEDFTKIYDHIKSSATNLDDFSRELNTFLVEKAKAMKSNQST